MHEARAARGVAWQGAFRRDRRRQPTSSNRWVFRYGPTSIFQCVENFLARRSGPGPPPVLGRRCPAEARAMRSSGDLFTWFYGCWIIIVQQ